MGSEKYASKTLGRLLAIWLGSIVLAGTILVVYFQMPLLPLVVAGAVTLALTLIRYIGGWTGKDH